MAHRPERSPPVQPRVRLEAGPLERRGAVPGPVQRRGEQNARETPVVTRAGAEIPYGVSSTYEIGRERAHFLKMLKKGMVADEKRWTLESGENCDRQGLAGDRKQPALEGEKHAQEGLEFALGIVQQDQHEGDPAGGVRRLCASAVYFPRCSRRERRKNRLLNLRVLELAAVDEFAAIVKQRVDEERSELRSVARQPQTAWCRPTRMGSRIR